jgi:hypothetical protein
MKNYFVRIFIEVEDQHVMTDNRWFDSKPAAEAFIKAYETIHCLAANYWVWNGDSASIIVFDANNWEYRG